MVKMTSAQAIVECMKRENVKHVFCVPGESYLPLMDAIYEEKDIELISNRHEGGAAFMAEGYGKTSNKPAVVMATRGVGAANLSIGIHTAFQDSTPMVVFLGQVHTKFRGREGFQEMELDRFLEQVTKWGVEIRDPERTPELVQRAFRIAQTGRPGPVVVSLPEDVLPKVADMNFAAGTLIPKPALSKEQTEEILSYLKKAERPVIIAGGGVKLSDGEEALQSFIEKTNIPVVASFRRHDVLSNDHPMYCGQLGLGTPPSQIETVRQADVILAVGTRLSEVTTQDYSLINPEQTLIHLDIEANVLGKVYPPALGLVADAKTAFDSLNKEVEEWDSSRWSSWSKERKEVFIQSSRMDEIDEAPWSIGYKEVIQAFNELCPKEAIITNDAGNFATWLQNFHSFTGKKSYAAPTSGAMGYGFPAGVGAKIANPERPVVVFAGDGGFMMTLQEIETAARNHIPVIVLLFNNSSYGTIRMHQERVYPDRVIGTKLTDVNYTMMAEAMGAIGVTADSAENFRSVFKEALHENVRPTIIELKMNPKQVSIGMKL
ncbi:acetolactate synthase-1/2/3 large subunit [Cytobacillus oceanisediminis]|uniref:Acetolactate synthase-1/2/3 large subunit n=1 Tax=Cytobacillus oceanisediminis TaxID=665099 RepID=A0A2V3A7I0_9BACI|nr:thiamine pyrophosphate-dependent enzyme [Cytobacillus oceanisediminis]PWW32141.1 acetolactate synthase-1/2/3 large subunit [Cytobacillus oceanisediminis]